MTKKITMTEAVNLYRSGNNAGEGFAPFGEGDSIDAAVEGLCDGGATLILARVTSDDVAVVERNGRLIAIGGDALGGNAWAVPLPRHWVGYGD